MARSSRAGRLLAPVLVALLASACTVASRPSLLMKKVGGSGMTVGELRARVRAPTSRFCGELELAADELSANSADPALRFAMTRFKINALPQMQMALFQPDPAAALIDGWALVVQLRDMLSNEAIRAHLTRSKQQHAYERLTAMEVELQQLWRALRGREDISADVERLHRWAAENPIDRALTTRKSTVPLLASLTGTRGGSPLAAAGQLLEGTQDLAARMDVLGAFLPKQARWQGEYLARDLLSDPTLISSAGAEPVALAALLQRVTATANGLPSVLSSERRAVMDGLQGATLDAKGFLSDQREAVTESLRAERLAATADLKLMGLAWIDRGFDRAGQLLDRVVLRLIVVLALLILGACLLAAIILRSRERRRPGARNPQPLREQVRSPS